MTDVGENRSETEEAREPQDGQPEGQPEAGAQATLEKQIEDLKKELKEQQNRYLYLYAEFDTYKKRAIKERADALKFGHESLVRELLHVADNLERALQHTDNRQALIDGIKMVNQQLKDTLAKFGVLEINALGEKFNPEQHEAVGQEKANGSKDTAEGTIVREHQKGYTFHGRLLRPSRVVVATK